MPLKVASSVTKTANGQDLYVSASSNSLGAVASVTGTANEIEVVDGTTNAVVSLAPPSPAPTAGDYTNANITVDGLGRVTAAASNVAPTFNSLNLLGPLAVSTQGSASDPIANGTAITATTAFITLGVTGGSFNGAFPLPNATANSKAFLQLTAFSTFVTPGTTPTFRTNIVLSEGVYQLLITQVVINGATRPGVTDTMSAVLLILN